MAQLGALGKGIPNIYLQKDYANTEGWCVRVETLVPIKNEKEVREWLDTRANSKPKELADSLIEQVPDGGDQFGARHMVAAALGYELADDGKSIGRPRLKPSSTERVVESGRRA